MTAVLIPTASEAEWLAARRKGITASEIAIVMGLAPESWNSPYKLYHQKTGDLPSDEDSLALRVGRHFEPLVAELFCERHPEFGAEGDGRTLYAHPERPWQLATPDRLVFECEPGYAGDQPLAVLECKTDGGFDGWGDDGSDEVPVHYRCQVLQQMDVLGVSTGFVACLFMNRRQVRVYELTMDDQAQADLALMLNEAERFLARLANGIPPDVDWRPQTSVALKHLHPDVEDVDVPIPWRLARWYRGACRRVKEAEERKRLYENRIRVILGSGHRAVSGRHGPAEVIARRDVYDVKAHIRKASHVDKLVAVPPPVVHSPPPIIGGYMPCCGRERRPKDVVDIDFSRVTCKPKEKS